MIETLLLDGLATLFLLGALACALGAVTARALFAACMAVAATCACAAVAVLARGADDAALALAFFGVGLAPVLVLGVLLLSARAVKPRKGGPVLGVLVAALFVLGAVAWLAPELITPRPAPVVEPSAAFWLAPLVFVAAIGVIGLLGYGERGAFARLRPDRRA